MPISLFCKKLGFKKWDRMDQKGAIGESGVPKEVSGTYIHEHNIQVTMSESGTKVSSGILYSNLKSHLVGQCIR